MTDALTVCRRAYQAYSEGDYPRLLGFFRPDVEVYVAPPNFEAGTYRGHDEYLALMERWGAAWDEMRIEPRELCWRYEVYWDEQNGAAAFEQRGGC